MTSTHFTIEGFDPLGTDSDSIGPTMTEVFEEAGRRVIHNILKSYTGYYDLFSELLQNALDAVQARQKQAPQGYKPRIWVTIDIKEGFVRVVDNGVGMTEEEFKYCLRPSVSFKRQAELRGHKGVGATFLAYGYSFLKLQSKRNNVTLAAILRQGRQWAEDASNTVPRPRFEGASFDVPELASEASGTCVQITLGGSSGERPRNLGWLGAHTADQWMDVLRIKTPLGGVYLSTPPFRPTIDLQVRAAEGTVTSRSTDNAEYYYPHDIPNQKSASLRDIQKSLGQIQGDANTKFTKLSSDFKRLDCIWDIWDKEELLKDDSLFASALGDDDKLLIERHNVIVYAAFLRSAKIWNEFSDEVLKLRKGTRITHGGLQIASDFMVQGDLMIIPLTSTIGYQANSHVVVHFTDGNPDMGRKTFQPELKNLAEALAVRAVNTMKRFLQHMKPDTGAHTITPDKELHDWKKRQEEYREHNPLSFEHKGNALALVAEPQQEQDVIALFHELIGLSVLKGFRFFATSQSDRYDSLFFMDYDQQDGILYDRTESRLGVTREYPLPYNTQPMVLEYKYSIDSLVSDFDKEEKFAKQLDFVVCWTTGAAYKEKLFLQSLLVGDEGSSRAIHGATHKAFLVGSAQPAFEVLVLEDLMNWLRDQAGEEARQRRIYRDA